MKRTLCAMLAAIFLLFTGCTPSDDIASASLRNTIQTGTDFSSVPKATVTLPSNTEPSSVPDTTVTMPTETEPATVPNPPLPCQPNRLQLRQKSSCFRR